MVCRCVVGVRWVWGGCAVGHQNYFWVTQGWTPLNQCLLVHVPCKFPKVAHLMRFHLVVAKLC